jgi:hypothetical protein
MFGTDVPIMTGNAKELWINVTNDGGTPIKRMRARAKLTSIKAPTPLPLPPQTKPEGMSETDWEHLLHEQQQFHITMESELSERTFGRALPFSRTPRGTVAFQWAQVDGRTSYEVDLSPKNDEASVKLMSIYLLDEFAVSRLNLHGNITTPENTKMVAYQIGGMTGTVINPSSTEGLAFNIAVKFWIIAENPTEEVSEIYHVEIPGSYEAVICTRHSKRSKEYKELAKKLSL